MKKGIKDNDLLQIFIACLILSIVVVGIIVGL